jgi:predicted dehydrogenase
VKRTITSGIVGAGYAATFHFEAVRRVHGARADVRGVFAADGEQARAYAAERGIRCFGSLEELLDAVDLVHVCVPVRAHEQVTVEALRRGKFVICEKPLTGYCGDGSDGFRGETCDKAVALDEAMASVRRMLQAEAAGGGRIGYAENWVYAPAIQKEREIITKTGAQVLWVHGEEAHSGSHAATYAYWKHSGGGVLIGKGCHPLTAALYLKRIEGLAREGRPIRPATVTGRAHAITRLPAFRDEGHLRSDYHDIDDLSLMHVVFSDGTVADVFASDIVLGGIHNWLEVAANNHRTICNLNPNNAMATYNPVEANFRDIYVVEKIGTKQGWSNPAPDEDHATGYPQEMEAFYRAAAYGSPVESDSRLAADAVATIYSAYLSASRDGAAVPVPLLSERPAP